MYAVIETGGKQYRVELGSEIEVDRMDVQPGQTIDLDRVLLVADGGEAIVGRPLVDGALVSADVLRQDRGEKIVVFKYKPKARRRVKKGARADLTVLRIADIAFAGRSAAQEDAAAQEQRRRAAEDAAAAAAARAAADQELAARLAAAPVAAPPQAAPPQAAPPPAPASVEETGEGVPETAAAGALDDEAAPAVDPGTASDGTSVETPADAPKDE
jgi:large subunit ribosomal protein L21